MIEIQLENPLQRHKRIRVDNHNHLLILGPANSNKHRGEIFYFDSVTKMKQAYQSKGGPLIEAFEEAQQFGAPHIFVANVESIDEYRDTFDILEQHDFPFILPIELSPFDYYYDASTSAMSSIPCALYPLEVMARKNHSIVIMNTDHANLYQDMDHYLEHLRLAEGFLKSHTHSGMELEKFFLTANNLSDVRYANVVIAAVISNSESVYPTEDFGEVNFLLDTNELQGSDIIYFKSHPDGVSTVENLVSFQEDGKPEKSLMALRSAHYIQRKLDLSAFAGRHFTLDMKTLVESAVEEFLETIKGQVIQDFGNIRAVYTPEPGGTGVLDVHFDILPRSSIYQYRVVMGVRA